MTTATTPRRRGGYGAYVNGANALALDETTGDTTTDDETTGDTTTGTRGARRRTTVDRATVDRATVDRATVDTGAEQVRQRAGAAKRARKAWISDVTPAQPEPVALPIALPRAPFVMLMVGLVVVGVLGVLVLNTKINENSFRLNDLRSQQTNLDLREQELQRSLADLESPGNLRAAATRLGLVPAGTPAFINLPDGRVVGVPQPAAGR